MLSWQVQFTAARTLFGYTGLAHRQLNNRWLENFHYVAQDWTANNPENCERFNSLWTSVPNQSLHRPRGLEKQAEHRTCQGEFRRSHPFKTAALEKTTRGFILSVQRPDHRRSCTYCAFLYFIFPKRSDRLSKEKNLPDNSHSPSSLPASPFFRKLAGTAPVSPQTPRFKYDLPKSADNLNIH